MADPSIIGILGTTEIGSAAAVLLHRAGFRVFLMGGLAGEEICRYHLSFGGARRHGEMTISGITGRYCPTGGEQHSSAGKPAESLAAVWKSGCLPVMGAEGGEKLLAAIDPAVLVLAGAAAAPFLSRCRAKIIGLLPRQVTGVDCQVLVDSREGFFAGNLYRSEEEIPENPLAGVFLKRPLEECRTPLAGFWKTARAAGEMIQFHETLGTVDEIAIRSPYNGQIWGLVPSGTPLAARSAVAHIFQGPPGPAYGRFSFHENAVAGGILAAVLQIIREAS